MSKINLKIKNIILSTIFILSSSLHATSQNDENLQSAIAGPSGIKIIEEASRNPHLSPENFFARQDSTNDLANQKPIWIGIERLTSENVEWWRAKLGHDVNMHFSAQSKKLADWSEAKVNEEGEEEETIEEALTRKGINLAIFNALKAQTDAANKLLPRLFFKNFILKSKSFFDQYSPDEKLNADLLSAWSGFKYNIDSYEGSETWISYVSSELLTGPLYKGGVEMMRSPSIKMAMTVKISEHFYSPLGIYRSPIAMKSDAINNDKSYGGLSLNLHAAVAGFMSMINPTGDIKYMTVRPVAKMKEIFEKSGVFCSATIGEIPEPSTKAPHILYTHRVQGEKKVEFFGDRNVAYKYDYVLVAPLNNEVLRMAKDHWFTSHTFLGEVHDAEILKKFPFVTASVKDLEKMNIQKR